MKKRACIFGKDMLDFCYQVEQRLLELCRNGESENAENEKYSHVASLEEVKDNEYNLNIPRYVDTFEEEEIIDIEVVNKEIEEIKTQIAAVEAQMEAYMKELGL